MRKYLPFDAVIKTYKMCHLKLTLSLGFFIFPPPPLLTSSSSPANLDENKNVPRNYFASQDTRSQNHLGNQLDLNDSNLDIDNDADGDDMEEDREDDNDTNEDGEVINEDHSTFLNPVSFQLSVGN